MTTALKKSAVKLASAVSVSLLAFCGSAAAAPWVLDFDTDAAGNAIVSTNLSGQIIDNEYATSGVNGTPGVVISTRGGIGHAVAFNSSATNTRDRDLEDDFSAVANPVSGATTGVNGFGNILIVQENNGHGCSGTHCNRPDDNYNRTSTTHNGDTIRGGVINFDFATEVFLTSIDFFDIESSQGGYVELIQFDNTVTTFNFFDVGDNGVSVLEFGQGVNRVVEVNVVIDGSGAVDNLRGQAAIVPEPATMGLLGLGLLGMGIMRRRNTV